jgi:large subunit ribosomal protein L24e
MEKGTGKIYVKKTGKILFFCSMKCEKNMLKLKRSPRKVKWTLSHEKGVEAKEA